MTTASPPVQSAASVGDVAERFAHLAADAGSSLSHGKLQALCYYAQALHWARHGRPLFDERIEAWPGMPVVPSLFERYGDRQIDSVPPSGPQPPALPQASQEALVAEVFERYRGITDIEILAFIITMTPWKDADNLEHEEIRPEALKDFGKRFDYLRTSEAPPAEPGNYAPASARAEARTARAGLSVAGD